MRFSVGLHHLGAHHFELLHKEGLKTLRASVEGRLLRVVEAAVVKDFGHIPDKVTKLLISFLIHSQLDRLQV